MNKDFLKGISKEGKKEFLNKLQSGKYILGEVYEPVQRLTFELQESGKYKCNETGQELTLEQVKALPGYRGTIDLVSDPDQVRGVKPPDEIIMMPWTEGEYLDSLLIAKNE